MQKDNEAESKPFRLDLTKIHHDEEEKSEQIPNESSDQTLSNSNTTMDIEKNSFSASN